MPPKVQKLLTFFQQKISVYIVINIVRLISALKLQKIDANISDQKLQKIERIKITKGTVFHIFLDLTDDIVCRQAQNIGFNIFIS